MITAFCLNPCIDRSIEIDELVRGGMNRVRAMRRDASGKGINVAILAQRLGLGGRVAGFLYEQGGDTVAEYLASEGVENACRTLPGTVRENLKILDRSRREITEVNQTGVPATEADWQPLFGDAVRFANEGPLVFTGSLPPGCPHTLYRDLMQYGREARLVLDAEGQTLLAGLEAKPWLIKPNSYELSLALGREINTLEETKAGALELVRLGAEIVCVSMGAQGAIITDGRVCYHAPRLNIEVVSTVGAGDCLLTGLICAFQNLASLPDALKMGVAMASAAVTLPGTLFPTEQQAKDMLPSVVICEI